jgi:hypothetical protein
VISCQEAVRRLWEHVELSPTGAEQAQLDAHLALCKRCCGEAGFADEMRRFLARHTAIDLPVDADVRLNLLIDRLEDAP